MHLKNKLLQSICTLWLYQQLCYWILKVMPPPGILVWLTRTPSSNNTLHFNKLVCTLWQSIISEAICDFRNSCCDPCDGVVAAAEDGFVDYSPPEQDSEHRAGNYVAFEYNRATVSMAHLMKESICVKPGDQICKGEFWVVSVIQGTRLNHTCIFTPKKDYMQGNSHWSAVSQCDLIEYSLPEMTASRREVWWNH